VPNIEIKDELWMISHEVPLLLIIVIRNAKLRILILELNVSIRYSISIVT